MAKKQNVVTRFMRRVDDSGGPESCWPWTGTRNRYGYGEIKIHGKTTAAHRVAWLLKHGPIPVGKQVLHACDNPPCVNFLSHLFLGTHQDNMKDRDQKGRQADRRGENHHGVKLTEIQIDFIRITYSIGAVSQRTLAKMVGVHQSAISRIVTGQRWPHSYKRR